MENSEEQNYIVPFLIHRGYPISSIRTEYSYKGKLKFDVAIFSENGNLIQAFEIKRANDSIGDKQRLKEAIHQFQLNQKSILEIYSEYYYLSISKEGKVLSILSFDNSNNEVQEYHAGTPNFESVLNYRRAIGRFAKKMQSAFFVEDNRFKVWLITNKIVFALLLIYLVAYISLKTTYNYWGFDLPLSYELLLLIFLIYILPFLHKIVPYIKSIRLFGLELETFYSEIRQSEERKNL